LRENCITQWDILERRLGIPEQLYIALPDRPTIADISYYPFAMPWMFRFIDVDLQKYPNIKAWGDRMGARTAVKAVLERGPTYGHDIKEL
jgi:glutathione S-transferase